MCLRASRERRTGAAPDPEFDGWVLVTPSPGADDTPEWLMQAERFLKQLCSGHPSELFPAGLAPTAEHDINRDLPAGRSRRSQLACLLKIALVLIVATRLLQLAILHAVLDPAQPAVAPVHSSARQHAVLQQPLRLVPAAETAEEQAAAVTMCVTVPPPGWWLGAAAAVAKEQAAAVWVAASTDAQGARGPSPLALPAPRPPPSPRLPMLSLPPSAPWRPPRPPRPPPAKSGGGSGGYRGSGGGGASATPQARRRWRGRRLGLRALARKAGRGAKAVLLVAASAAGACILPQGGALLEPPPQPQPQP